MHDLATIQRLNQQATEAAVPQLRAAGKHVLVISEGLTVASVVGYDTADQLIAALDAARHGDQAVGRTFTAYKPFDENSAAAAVAKGRDQSEDRTLGDYVARKLAAAGNQE